MPFQQRPPEHGACTADFTCAAHVGDVAHPTGGLHRHARRQRAQVCIQLQVGPGQHAVAGDVGAQQVAQAGAQVARQEFVQGDACIFGPAVHRQAPGAGRIAARVQRHGDALATELVQPGGHRRRFAHRQRPDHHPRRAGVQDPRHVLAAAHPATGLYLQAGAASDLFQQPGQGVATGPGRIQVDQVHPARTGGGEGGRTRQRIVAVARFARVVALRQPHHAAVADIQRRVDGEVHQKSISRKLPRMRAPVAAERSGWNWAPQWRPRCTTALNRPPWSLAATVSALTGAA